MAKTLLHRYTFAPSSNTVVIEGNIHRRRLLLITNVTDNKLIYNFADPNLTATSITFDSAAEETTVVLSYDCSAMSSSDTLQILIEEDAVKFKPSPTYTDPVSKFRVSQAQTLIDTDFEYGLQSTKWETLELVNNIPGFYSSTGDVALNLTYIKSTSGSKILTVTSIDHGLIVGTPFDVRGLNQSNLDGSYIVESVSGNDVFTFAARNIANSTGTISGAYTYLVPGKFYTGSDISYDLITTDGATPSTIAVTTPYPHGFTSGTEFYIIDTLGTQSLEFDASNVEVANTITTTKTFDPNEYNSTNGTGIRKTDIWDYASTLNVKFARGGDDVATNAININSHGFTNNQVVLFHVAPNSTAPTGLTSNRRYYIVSATTNSFSLSLTSGGAAVSITAGTGSGILAFYRGYTALSMNNTTTDVVTWNEDTSGTDLNTPLLCIGPTAGTNIMQTLVTTQNSAKLYNDSTTVTYYYFQAAGTTTRTLSLASGGGTRINFTATTATVSENVFIPLVLNPTRNTFYIANHGFNTDELWAYDNGGGTSITNLTNGVSYYIDVADTNQFGVKTSTVGSRIDITAYGAVGAAHSFQRTVNNPIANTIYIPSHGLSDNLEVVYEVGSGTTIGGLTGGLTYYTRDVSEDRFRLSETQGSESIDITSAGVGIQTFVTTTTGAFDGVYTISSVGLGTTGFRFENSNLTVPNIVATFNPQSKLYVSADNFIEIPSHRLSTGTQVLYNNGGGGNIDGLTSGSSYYVIRIAKDGIRLANSFEDAIAGIAITFGSTGSGTQHTLTSSNLNGENIGVGTIRITANSRVVEGFGTKFNRSFKSGDTIVVGVSSTSVYEGIVYGVLSDTKLEVNDPAPSSSVSDTYFLKPTSIYVKSNSFSVHRPFDGGVEINAGFNADSQIVRQTRRYFRYQSGKGLSSQFAINFNPPLDISTISGLGTIATAVTRYPHGLTTSQTVTIRDAEVTNGPNPYNGEYTVKSVIDSNTFDYYMDGAPSQSIVSGFPQLVVKSWGGSKLRAGMYDFQNGMFYEYDGDQLYAVRRDSTGQLGGTVSVTYNSNEIIGSGTRFLQQLVVGDRVVIRGQSYKVINITNNTTMYVQPAYRGTTNSNIIVSKTVDTKTAQTNWSIDSCDGTGETGYVLDVTRIQMAYMDYSWYGAGKIRFGFKDQEGEVIYVHEYKHNNRRNEAFMRSGNLPARYEIINVGVPNFAPSLAHWGTTVQMDGKFEDDGAYLFTASAPFLTFSGSTATAVGTAGNYTYVSADGTSSTGITTFSSRNTSGVSFGPGSDYVTISNHGLSTGALVQYINTGGTVIGGLTSGNYYYVVRRDTNTFRLATTLANAQANAFIDLTSAGTGTHTFRFSFAFSVTPTNVTGFGERYIHRFLTDASGFASIGNVSFGTEITSTAIAAKGTAYVYRIISAGGGQAYVDFFFSSAPSSPTASTNFIGNQTASNISHTFGGVIPVPDIIPLISLRLAPSVDGGITGLLGHRDIINRMQLALDSLGVLTTHDVEIRLILNGQVDSLTWQSQPIPSLSQVISHNSYDLVSGGTQVFSFRATGNPPDANGRRTPNAFTADISSLLSLGNCILGGDGVYPNGPDVLTIAAAPLNTTGITVNTPMSISARLSWKESQA